jgi:hypothetical protein
VREPLYTRSSGRARHYARELEPLADYLRASTQGLGEVPGPLRQPESPR